MKSMKIKLKNIILLILFVFLSVWVYAAILGCWAVLEVPLLLSLPRNKIIISAGMLFGSAIGAVMSAFVLAFPMGYLTKQLPKVLGGALGIMGTIAYFFICPARLQQFDWFVGASTIVEHAAFIAGCMLFAVLGCHVGNRRLGNG
jgi:hypothetical protein